MSKKTLPYNQSWQSDNFIIIYMANTLLDDYLSDIHICKRWRKILKNRKIELTDTTTPSALFIANNNFYRNHCNTRIFIVRIHDIISDLTSEKLLFNFFFSF